ncbi:MAG: hypothetical protein KDD55_04705 [Bdellovibrionales bacterium]|nr:hypothetical protein [Bdellovibrionales bacterium]
MKNLFRLKRFCFLLFLCLPQGLLAQDYQQIPINCPQGFTNCGAGMVGTDASTHCTWGGAYVCEIPGPFGSCLQRGYWVFGSGDLENCLGAPAHESLFFPPDAPPIEGFLVTSSHLICSGDTVGVNGYPDGKIGYDDLLAILSHWDEQVKSESPYDLNQDSEVGQPDLSLVLENFGTICE